MSDPVLDDLPRRGLGPGWGYRHHRARRLPRIGRDHAFGDAGEADHVSGPEAGNGDHHRSRSADHLDPRGHPAGALSGGLGV